MEEDRSLGGAGRYPANGPLAVAARLAFVGAILAIVAAVLAPPWTVPDFVRSPYLQHFAAFYVATLLGLAALPRNGLRTIVGGFLLFITLLEGSRLIAGGRPGALLDNWVADVGGVFAAVAPMIVERFRRRLGRR